MRRPIVGILLCALALASAGCTSNTTPTTPTTPTVKTETFTGTLNQNGAVTNTFLTASSGQVIATLTAVGPDATLPIGFSLGTYSTTLNVCQVVLANDLAVQGAILTGAASTQGAYCVRVYDTGKVTPDNPFTFTITVAHP